MSSLRDLPARGRLTLLSRSLIPLCIPWCYIYPPNIPGVICLHSETFLLGAGWLFSHVLWFHYVYPDVIFNLQIYLVLYVFTQRPSCSRQADSSLTFSDSIMYTLILNLSSKYTWCYMSSLRDLPARGRLIRLSRSLIPSCIPWFYIYPPNIPGVICLHSETFLLGAGWLFSHVLWFHYVYPDFIFILQIYLVLYVFTERPSC